MKQKVKEERNEVDELEDVDSVEETCKERVEDLIENIKNKDFDEFMDLLDKVRQVHGSYSLNNLMLIKIQKPDATVVNGYNQWQDYGRQVKKGESSIKILAPKLYKVCPECRDTRKYHDEENCEDNTDYENWPKRCLSFISVSVFDISQTKKIEGEDSFEMPDLKAKGENGEQIYNRLEETALNWVNSIKVKNLGVNGMYNKLNENVLLDDREYAAMAGTLVHELAHHFINKSDKTYSKNREEMIVEAVSYAVMEEMGLDSTDSEKYIKNFETEEGDVDDLKEDIEFIVETSNKIIQNFRD